MLNKCLLNCTLQTPPRKGALHPKYTVNFRHVQAGWRQEIELQVLFSAKIITEEYC